ncbi:MAG: glycogen synthase GlgA [Azospirillaceae bacterium]|nr:glycogen synthase GlgA [Azospirillaceae bacterium]
MRVLFVASECYPLVKTGGLGDVVAALPPALRRCGADVRLLLPGYPSVLDGVPDARPVWTVPDIPGGGAGILLFGTGPDGVPVYVLQAPWLYERPGNPYVGPGGDWADNPQRFAALSWAAAWLSGTDGGRRWRPDILHAHDWQTGLAPAYLALSGRANRPGTIMTIHNIAYQGLADPELLTTLHLPAESFDVEGVEFYGHIGFLKAGLYYADRITTVSPNYAREIQTLEGGWGLQGLLSGRRDDLSGIVNGVDAGIWNPMTDRHLAAPFGIESLDARRANKAALLAETGLDDRLDAPLFAVVSRLTELKGFDLLLAALPYLIDRGGQLVVLGTGDPGLEDGFRAAAARWPGRVAAQIKFDEALSHRIQAGADVVILPSRSEPCGLIQLYALAYGALPLVRRVGGLADTVKDGMTGFVFDHASADDLVGAIGRAADLWWTDPAEWRVRQVAGMAEDWSWSRSAADYMALYQALFPSV